MGMMKMIGNVGRKFRTAVMKKTRPKTYVSSEMSMGWRARNRAGHPQAGNEFAQQQKSVDFLIRNKPEPARPAKQSLNEWDWETEGIPEHARRSAPKVSRKARITYKGQDMQERNFMKNYKMAGSYKYGTFVSKEAYRTGGKKAVSDSYGRKGLSNYKTRSYQS